MSKSKVLEGDVKVALLDLSYAELEEFFSSLGQPSYRAAQVARWLYKRLATDFDELHNLPLTLRERLKEGAQIDLLTLLEEVTSPDGLTTKALFALRDGETIESVLMRYRRRNTVCLSTQVGCAIGCPFCATGQSGFVRDLSPGEIVGQVLHFARRVERVTNIVFMGMGEPLANYEATWQAVRILTDPRCFGLGARHLIISTVGLVPGIERLSKEPLQVGLAVSLHAPNDPLRDRLVPLNRRYPLAPLLAACREYVERTGRRITFEYALIEGLNDSSQQAEELALLLEGLLCHVNLIPLNPTPDCPWRGSSRKRASAFRKALSERGVRATLRLGRGVEIQAGCGQLRSRPRIDFL